MSKGISSKSGPLVGGGCSDSSSALPGPSTAKTTVASSQASRARRRAEMAPSTRKRQPSAMRQARLTSMGEAALVALPR
eukprot:8670413-Pyramimonas_sp.AAC.1